MDLSKRLVHVKSSAKETYYFFLRISYIQKDILNHPIHLNALSYSLQQDLLLKYAALMISLLGQGPPCCCLLDIHMLAYTLYLVNSWKTKPWRRGRSMSSCLFNLWNKRVMEVYSHTLFPKRRLSQ